MEEELGDGRDWLMGDAYTLADVSLTSYLNRVAELQLQPMWERERSRVSARFDRVQERPNFVSVYVDYPYDAYRAQMADQGRANWPKVGRYCRPADPGLRRAVSRCRRTR